MRESCAWSLNKERIINVISKNTENTQSIYIAWDTDRCKQMGFYCINIDKWITYYTIKANACIKARIPYLAPKENMLFALCLPLDLWPRLNSWKIRCAWYEVAPMAWDKREGLVLEEGLWKGVGGGSYIKTYRHIVFDVWIRGQKLKWTRGGAGYKRVQGTGVKWDLLKKFLKGGGGVHGSPHLPDHFRGGHTRNRGKSIRILSEKCVSGRRLLYTHQTTSTRKERLSKTRCTLYIWTR